jgi:hypothetical protein
MGHCTVPAGGYRTLRIPPDWHSVQRWHPARFLQEGEAAPGVWTGRTHPCCTDHCRDRQPTRPRHARFQPSTERRVLYSGPASASLAASCTQAYSDVWCWSLVSVQQGRAFGNRAQGETKTTHSHTQPHTHTHTHARTHSRHTQRLTHTSTIWEHHGHGRRLVHI